VLNSILIWPNTAFVWCGFINFSRQSCVVDKLKNFGGDVSGQIMLLETSFVLERDTKHFAVCGLCHSAAAAAAAANFPGDRN